MVGGSGVDQKLIRRVFPNIFFFIFVVPIHIFFFLSNVDQLHDTSLLATQRLYVFSSSYRYTMASRAWDTDFSMTLRSASQANSLSIDISHNVMFPLTMWIWLFRCSLCQTSLTAWSSGPSWQSLHYYVFQFIGISFCQTGS